MALAPNTVLQSRYRIVRKLGEGGMGSVYLAIDLRFDSELAIKESHFTDASRRQFEREARLLNRLKHPAMTRVIDHFTEGDGQFLVMDYVEGEDLWEMLRKRDGSFPPDKVLEWADHYWTHSVISISKTRRLFTDTLSRKIRSYRIADKSSCLTEVNLNQLLNE